MGRSGMYRLQYSQNFLKPALAGQLIAGSGIGNDDLVIEVGPGTGVLTVALARHAGQVIAIEHDPELAGRLSEKFQKNRRVCVFACDALQFPMPSTPFKVFANIPFRHTSAIVGKLTTGTAPPLDSWLIMQQEAAERYLLEGKTTMVAMSLAPWFTVSIEHRFSRQDFRPAPRVDSVLLRIQRRVQPLVDTDQRERFTHLIEAAYSAWRPTLAESLAARLPRRAAGSVLNALGPALAKRPSQAHLETWVRVFEVLEMRDDDLVWDVLQRASSVLRAQQASLDRPTRTPAPGGRARRR